MTFFEKFDAVFYQETMLSSGVFRRETARGFYPWGKVDSPRKRVAEELCGCRHGNSFPMAQNAQSHRQMRSIPHCPKAVFYVFVFHSIHNSAIKLIIAPLFFPLNRFIPGRGWRGCQRAGWRFRACRWLSRCWWSRSEVAPCCRTAHAPPPPDFFFFLKSTSQQVNGPTSQQVNKSTSGCLIGLISPTGPIGSVLDPKGPFRVCPTS